jgi:hypothetical protein
MIVRYGTSRKRRIFDVAWRCYPVANFLERRQHEVRRTLPSTHSGEQGYFTR